MRFSSILMIAVLLTPVALSARPASGLSAAQTTDLSAVKKKKATKKVKKVKEEYLKAAPGSGPSGPKK